MCEFGLRAREKCSNTFQFYQCYENDVTQLQDILRVIRAAGLSVMDVMHRNIFRVTGPLWGESIGHRWIHFREGKNAELWCFLWKTPE